MLSASLHLPLLIASFRPSLFSLPPNGPIEETGSTVLGALDSSGLGDNAAYGSAPLLTSTQEGCLRVHISSHKHDGWGH